MPYTTFQVAVNRGRHQPISPRVMTDRDQQDKYVDYPWVLVDGEQAETCYNDLKSGMRVAIHGAEIRTHRYSEAAVGNTLEFKFCPHCGTKLDTAHFHETKSRKWFICGNNDCEAEVIVERVRLGYDVKAKYIEYFDKTNSDDDPMADMASDLNSKRNTSSFSEKANGKAENTTQQKNPPNVPSSTKSDSGGKQQSKNQNQGSKGQHRKAQQNKGNRQQKSNSKKPQNQSKSEAKQNPQQTQHQAQ